MAHKRCVPDKQHYMHLCACACLRARIHTDHLVILIAFARQQWFANAPQSYVMCTLPVLFKFHWYSVEILRNIITTKTTNNKNNNKTTITTTTISTTTTTTITTTALQIHCTNFMFRRKYFKTLCLSLYLTPASFNSYRGCIMSDHLHDVTTVSRRIYVIGLIENFPSFFKQRTERESLTEWCIFVRSGMTSK
jgi:hypothetical protein